MAEKFTDYLLGFTQTDNFINIGAFAKQSSLFQTIAMDGGALSNITWIFAFIGFVYIALNPSSWKATVIGPWLFLLLLFQSGKFSEPLFFKKFNFTQDFQNSYLDCTAIQNDAVPHTIVDETDGKVKVRCVAKEDPNSSGSTNANLPAGVVLDEESFFNEDGNKVIVTTKEVLKLKGIDIASNEFAAVYAYTPQLVLIDTLTRLHTIMADALLHKMDQTASGILASSRAARTASLIDKRPIYEANMFEQACNDVEGIQNVTFLSPDQADKRFPDVVSGLKQRPLSLYDLLVSFNFFYNSIKVNPKTSDMINQYTMRPPVATKFTIGSNSSGAYGSRTRNQARTFTSSMEAQLKGLTAFAGFENLNSPADLLKILEQDFNSVEDSNDKIPATPLSMLYLDPDVHTPSWFTAFFFNRPSDLKPELFIDRIRKDGEKLYKYLFSEAVPATERNAFLNILKAVRVNSAYFGTPKYAPLATTNVGDGNFSDENAARAAQNQYGKEIVVGSANVNANQSSATGVGGDKHINSAYVAKGPGKAVTCYDYYTYIAELTDEAILYQIDMFRDLPEIFSQVEAGKFAHVTRSLKRNYPECVNTNNARSVPRVSDQCNAEKVRQFVMDSGASNMARLEAIRLHEEATTPEFSMTLSGEAKKISSNIGEWLFDDESGDLIVSIVNAFSGFMTGSFAALMPKIIAWMTALVIVVTPFLYMMGLIVPVWGLSIILMPLIGVLYLQSVQIVYVVIKAAFGNLNQFVTTGGEQTNHLAMFDMVLGLMYISVFLFTAFMLFNLNDAGAMVRQMSGKLDSSATIDAKEVIGGAMAVAGVAALPGKAAGAALGAVKGVSHFAHSGNMLTNVAGSVMGAVNEGAESGVNHKHKNIANLGGFDSESANYAKTVETSAANATAKNKNKVATKEAFDKAGPGSARKSGKVMRDGQEYDLGTGSGHLSDAVHEIHTDAKIAQEVTIKLIDEMANKGGFKGNPVLNDQTKQYEQQISPEMLSTLFQKTGDELSKAVAANKKFRTNDKGEAFIVFGEVPGGSSSKSSPEPKEEQPKGKPTR